MTTTNTGHDYYDEVLRYADSLNTVENNDWDRAILEGCPRPLPASAVLDIADWIDYEGPLAWTVDPDKLGQIADDLRAIVEGRG